MILVLFLDNIIWLFRSLLVHLYNLINKITQMEKTSIETENDRLKNELGVLKNENKNLSQKLEKSKCKTDQWKLFRGN